MSAADIITNPDLRAVLDAATLAQQQCDALLALLAQNPLPPRTAASDATLALPPDVAEAVSTAQKTLHAHLAVVRNQNRKALLSVRATKLATADARHEVDTLHLALQNLYYEQRHLESEIKACQGYDHPFQKLPLMPEDEFREQFSDVVEGCRDLAAKAVAEEKDAEGKGGADGGEDVGMGGDADGGPAAFEEELFEDALMKARIEHEHKERLALEEKRQGLLKRKQGLIAENNKRKEDLAKLDESLEKFIEAAKPIEQTFQKEY